MKALISYIIILFSNFLFINPNINDSSIFNKNQENLINNNKLRLTSITYELSYDDTSVIRIILRISNISLFSLNFKSFNALLKEDEGFQEFTLNCSKILTDSIICLSSKNIILDVSKKYYFYYNSHMNGNDIVFEGNDIIKDNKRISLIFKPIIQNNITIFNNCKSFLVKTNKDMVSSGNLYLTRKSKKVLQTPKNGFNKYIQLNNFIPHCGLGVYMPQSSLISYTEAIRRGYKMVDADILFTKDKIPVVCHGNNLELVSNGKGFITEKSLKELEELDFGIKYSEKYAGLKILKFEELLKLCKENNIIIDLDLWHLNTKQFFSTDEYIKIILKYVDKYDMINSIFFNDERKSVIKLFQSIRNNISFSINGMNEKKNIESIKDKYNTSKIIIYNMGFLSSGRTINEKTVKYGLSLGKKIKAAKIDDIKFAEKVASWGVNFICTNKLHPFLIKNEKEEPIIVSCSTLETNNGDSKCKIDENAKLIDNEIYNIYYTTNIYNSSEDIIEEPIGELKYIDTNKNHKLYYSIENFDFKIGLIRLKTSKIIKKNEEIFGEIGPSYDNVAECFTYNFICIGKNSHTIDCVINKKFPGKVEYEGNYTIYRLEGYSLNPKEVYINLNHQRNEEYKVILIILVLFMLAFIKKILFHNKKVDKKQ